uniref:Uncharacterized protein n=1 Tax=Peronospora matthiolae TaxID=2874970 RepID=A0AAV1USH4_9STRA
MKNDLNLVIRRKPPYGACADTVVVSSAIPSKA